MALSRRRFEEGSWLAALCAAAVFAVFSPSLDNGYVGWDDDIYITENPAIRGFGWTQARWAFTTTRGGLWQPLTWLSFSADQALFGPEAWGSHLTSLLLHALGAVLCFLVLRELLRAGLGRDEPRAAAVGALFFALHPLRVESVAWAVERKDVLCGAFFLGSVLAYLRRNFYLALPLYACSLMSKAASVPLPVVLLLLDIYPLRRLPWEPRLWLERRYRAIWLEKAAFVGVAVAGAAATLLALGAWGEVRGLVQHPWPWRIGQALYGLCWYPLKTLWPTELLPYYPPRPWFGRLWPEAVFIGAAAAGATAAAWVMRRRAPALLAAVLSYALLVAPGLGLVQNALPFSVCDRYSYLAALPLAGLVATGWAVFLRGGVAVLLGLLILAACGAASYAQTRHWKDSETLWARAAAFAPSPVPLQNLGVARARAGRRDEAMALFRRAAEEPGFADALENLGAALAASGRRAEAEDSLRKALAAKPFSPSIRRKLGVVLAEGPRAVWGEAEVLLRAAADGGAGRSRSELGVLLARQGRVREAMAEYERACAEKDGDGLAANNLGLLLDAQGRRAEAREKFRLAMRSDQWRSEANYNLGNSLLADGEEARALRRYDEALRLKPALARARVNRANIFARRGRLAEAAFEYRRALKSEPGLEEARLNLSAVERFLGRGR